MADREPLCGFCWARGVRTPLEFILKHGFWQCPTCWSKTVTPEKDEREIRRWLAEEAEDFRPRCLPVNSIIARDPEKTVASTRHLRPGGGNKSGKKRGGKKPVPPTHLHDYLG